MHTLPNLTTDGLLLVRGQGQETDFINIIGNFIRLYMN